MNPLAVVLAGGGSAGHVNPLLATAEALRRRVPDVRIAVLGTAEGLEAHLVPERGLDLRIVPKVPFPRRPNRAALAFPGALARSVGAASAVLTELEADVVVGFGGYVATPAYLAARRAGVPIVIHEQNARPGLANRLGARITRSVATTFESTSLPHARRVGLPLRDEIRFLDRDSAHAEGLAHFGLDEGRPTLLVFGGSLGAQRLNQAFEAAAADLLGAGVQVLHLTGAGKHVSVPESLAGTDAGPGPQTYEPGAEPGPETDDEPGAAATSGRARYVALEYTDRMELAYAVADLAVCRAGAGTVSELAAVGLPAIYVPLPIGNGEQRLNAADVVGAGGGLLVDDAQVDADWVRRTVLPLVVDESRLTRMAAAAAAHGEREADELLVDLILDAAGQGSARDARDGSRGA